VKNNQTAQKPPHFLIRDFSSRRVGKHCFEYLQIVPHLGRGESFNPYLAELYGRVGGARPIKDPLQMSVEFRPILTDHYANSIPVRVERPTRSARESLPAI